MFTHWSNMMKRALSALVFVSCISAAFAQAPLDPYSFSTLQSETGRLRFELRAGNPVKFDIIESSAARELRSDTPERQLVKAIDRSLVSGAESTRRNAVLTMKSIKNLLERLAMDFQPNANVSTHAESARKRFAELPPVPFELAALIRDSGEALRTTANATRRSNCLTS
jgi:hypothetical protein